MKIFTEKDVDTSALAGERIAVLGYGSQGHAHALNLKDSGFDVVVGLRQNGKSWQQAKDAGLSVAPLEEAVKSARLVAMLVPDMAQEEVYKSAVKDNLKEGDALLFAHGFSILYGQIRPPENVDVVLIAPKGPGNLVRREYEKNQGVPCLLATHQNYTGKATERALMYAHGIGGTRAGVLQTTFSEETETDLFGEQAVLCGGVSELITQGYETLVEAGYQPEAAYFECLHEMKLIVDLLHEGGMSRMLNFVSETAKYGDFVSGPRVINGETKKRMQEVLADIQTGKFARDWILENQAGRPHYNKLWDKVTQHPIEKVGASLRSLMPWLLRNKN